MLPSCNSLSRILRRCRNLCRPRHLSKSSLIGLAALLLLVGNCLLLRLGGDPESAGNSGLTTTGEQNEDSSPGGGRFRRISQHLAASDVGTGEDRSVIVDAWSGTDFTALAIDGVLLVNQSTKGLHLFIVNQATASLMGYQVFQRLNQLKPLLLTVTPGRVIILTSVPPFRSAASADEAAALRMLGSRRSDDWSRHKRGEAGGEDSTPWVLVAFAKIGRINEQLARPGLQLRLRTRVRLVSEDETICPSWPPTEETSRRRQFCRLAEGFSNVCDCGRPTAISYPSRPAPWSTTGQVPLTVMSSNRPQYLFRTLVSLLSLKPLNVSQTQVTLRGFFEEPRLICDLLRLPYTQRKLVSPTLANLYRLGLANSFKLFPSASFAILIEDDVDPSPDLIDFFNQTLPLMAKDQNLFCIGAWNDQSFTHTTADPGELHRTQLVPLKVLAVRRSAWETQLSEQWPEGPVDLAAFLTSAMGPSRYCLRPALSRAFVYSQSLRLIDRLRPTYRTTDTEFIIDQNAQMNYDSRLQSLIDRSISLNAQFARKCHTAVLTATSLASKQNLTLPSLILTARVTSHRAMEAFWSHVARCFSLNNNLTCLYKGTCQISFLRFVLIVVFRPHSPFRIPTGMAADLTVDPDRRSRHRRRLGHR